MNAYQKINVSVPDLDRASVELGYSPRLHSVQARLVRHCGTDAGASGAPNIDSDLYETPNGVRFEARSNAGDCRIDPQATVDVATAKLLGIG